MHISVLQKEIIEMSNVKSGDIVVDATLGSGGHTLELLQVVGAGGHVVAIDIDNDAIEFVKKEIEKVQPEFIGRVTFVNENFAKIAQVIQGLELSKKPAAIIADLGWRIEQIEGEKYGMSFQKDFPLDMRLGEKIGKITAADIVNLWSENQLADLFMVYGEERFARLIAKKIIERRKDKRIETTKELAQLVADAKSVGRGRINPATKVFQALRIATNDELENLKKFIEGSIQVLEEGGRLAIISFHSIEDRIVKNMFRTNAGGCVCSKELPVCMCGSKTKIKIVTKKPVTASREELSKNPRSRSAKLRVAQKVEES